MPWMPAEERGSFLCLSTPNGSACITPWANPGFWHGVIFYADGHVEYVPPTDHHANQGHMRDLPARLASTATPPFEHSADAAKAFVEWKLDPPAGHRPTARERVNQEPNQAWPRR